MLPRRGGLADPLSSLSRNVPARRGRGRDYRNLHRGGHHGARYRARGRLPRDQPRPLRRFCDLDEAARSLERDARHEGAGKAPRGEEGGSCAQSPTGEGEGGAQGQTSAGEEGEARKEASEEARERDGGEGREDEDVNARRGRGRGRRDG